VDTVLVVNCCLTCVWNIFHVVGSSDLTTWKVLVQLSLSFFWTFDFWTVFFMSSFGFLCSLFVACSFWYVIIYLWAYWRTACMLSLVSLSFFLVCTLNNFVQISFFNLLLIPYSLFSCTVYGTICIILGGIFKNSFS
jgi:hypothetical protein